VFNKKLNIGDVIIISYIGFKTKEYTIKDLKKIEEDDVLIEGREVYVNGKIYKVSLRNGTLDNSISKDKDGNYVVQLQAKNGRIVILKGSVADAIVYNNLLNNVFALYLFYQSFYI
jgi:hypothetical protein